MAPKRLAFNKFCATWGTYLTLVKLPGPIKQQLRVGTRRDLLVEVGFGGGVISIICLLIMLMFVLHTCIISYIN